MKKYAIILGLAVLATGAMAQTNNNVTLTQRNSYQMADIQQIGSNNTSTIEQFSGTLVPGVDNPSAFIGLFPDYSKGNLVVLQQNGTTAVPTLDATLKQYGQHNLILVKQTYYGTTANYATITQTGKNNIVATLPIPSASNPSFGVQCVTSFSFCNVPGWKPKPCLLGIPFADNGLVDSNFGLVDVQGQLEVTQTGDDNSFLVGEGNPLKGKTIISQTGGNDNTIWLIKRSDKKLTITQTGKENLTALDINAGGESKIEQIGNNNVVAKYKFTVLFTGFCENCPSYMGQFKGDELTIGQYGNYNKISLESTSTGTSDVTINQWGNYNLARVRN